MKLSDIPSAKFSIPFANAAGGGYIRSIPTASQIGIQNGAASLTDGFPPLTFLPVGSGGVPPFGQDMNGLLKQITQWSRWQNAGGFVPYDSAFSSAVGGYPKTSVLASASTAGLLFISTIDDNTNNPDAVTTGWVRISNISDAQSGTYNFAVAGGTANSLTLTLAPAPDAYAAGLIVRFVTGGADNSGAMTLNVDGLGAKSLVTRANTAIAAGQVPAGTAIEAMYDGTAFRVLGMLAATPAMAAAGVSLVDALTPGSLFSKQNPYFISAGSANQSIPVGVDTVVTNLGAPTSNFFNSGSSFSAGVFTCGAKDAGAWLFIGYAALTIASVASSAGNDYRASIGRNGSSGPFMSTFISAIDTYGLITINPYALSAGDTVDLRVFQNTQTNRNINATQFFGMRLSAA